MRKRTTSTISRLFTVFLFLWLQIQLQVSLARPSPNHIGCDFVLQKNQQVNAFERSAIMGSSPEVDSALTSFAADVSNDGNLVLNITLDTGSIGSNAQWVIQTERSDLSLDIVSSTTATKGNCAGTDYEIIYNLRAADEVQLELLDSSNGTFEYNVVAATGFGGTVKLQAFTEPEATPSPTANVPTTGSPTEVGEASSPTSPPTTTTPTVSPSTTSPTSPTTVSPTTQQSSVQDKPLDEIRAENMPYYVSALVLLCLGYLYFLLMTFHALACENSKERKMEIEDIENKKRENKREMAKEELKLRKLRGQISEKIEKLNSLRNLQKQISEVSR
mmetsp:Transcript_33877/g.41756  ORF Transcript_33877/g.41756 Transcript_33877/m.41756 type:complete len:332 (+) Transcript_33877:275-1270(+)